jgi:anti-sigma factor RsiW
MIDRGTLVTEDELHAYADGEIPPDRRHDVAAWLASHPEDAARVAEWRTQADAIRTRYGAVANEPVPAQLSLAELDRQASARHPRRWRAIAAAAAAAFLLGGVAGWFAHGAAATAPSSFDLYTTDALEAYRLYVVEVRHPVEVPGAERQHLTEWLSKRLDTDVRAPDLQSVGLMLVGGRLIPGPSGAATALFMYEGPSGDRFTLYCTHSRSPETAMRYREADRVASVYWVDRGLAYVVSGPSDRPRLSAIAKSAYDQIDSPARPAGG